jgi:gas vesicle protein
LTTTEKVSTGLVFLGVGAAIGATLALLFAPKKGSELRDEIADTARKGYDATLEKATELKDQSLKAVQVVKDKAGAVIDLAADKFAADKSIVEDVISNTTGAIADGIERMQNESGVVPAGRTTRKPTNIM